LSFHRHGETVRIGAPLDAVWAFFSDPRNLPRITPPWLGFQVTSDPPGAMYPGLIITYRIHPLGPLPMTWVTEITHVVDRLLFVDEQRAGPYRFWHHEHHFRPIEGGTEMQDIVTYALPFGPLGDIINTLTVRKRIDAIFQFRGEALAERFPILGDAAAPASNGIVSGP
jgi:ligand-binding SRPBCC domain-containing protein